MAFTSFVGGAALSLPLAILLDHSRYYGASEIALLLPVALAIGVAVVRGARGRQKIMIDVLATLVGRACYPASRSEPTICFAGNDARSFLAASGRRTNSGFKVRFGLVHCR